jgi:hypothetical protein
MFHNAEVFNANLSLWNVSSVMTMDAMFNSASAFQQNLCPWGHRLRPNTNVRKMFYYTKCPSKASPSFNKTPAGPFC